MCRVCVSMAIHTHGLCSFSVPKLHRSSAPTSGRPMSTSRGVTTGSTWRCAGKAAQRATIQSISHRSLTPPHARSHGGRFSPRVSVLPSPVGLPQSDGFRRGRRLGGHTAGSVVVVLPGMPMALVLEALRSPRWTYLSHTPNALLASVVAGGAYYQPYHGRVSRAFPLQHDRPSRIMSVAAPPEALVGAVGVACRRAPAA
jgi:hypothetical protein